MEGWKHKDLKSKDFDYIKELFDKVFKRVNMFVDFRTELVEGSSKRASTELEQEVTKKQKVDGVQETDEVDDYKETTEIKQLMEITPNEEEVTIDAVHLAVKEDLENLYKLVKAKYESTRSVEDLDLILWGDLKTMFELHIEDEVWKKQQGNKVLNWKLYDSCRSKLVLLENFNENYSKCLRISHHNPSHMHPSRLSGKMNSEGLSIEKLELLIYQGLLKMQVALHLISDSLPEILLTSISP
ncbi:hypothetical protein Tco_0570809 [Tanacetum coccineum]